MDNWEDIQQRLRENEEIAYKFFQVETQILGTLNFRDLFDRLLAQIKRVFALPWVWVSLVEGTEVTAMISSLEESCEPGTLPVRVCRTDFLSLLGPLNAPLLIDKDLSDFSLLFPVDAHWPAASMAVIPLRLDDHIIGSLNLADNDPTRFQPGMDPSLLQQLGIKVNLCLSNVSAHEKLKALAFRDTLTGLLNRRVMVSALEREFERAVRYGHALSVVFLDMDGFKEINDRWGHDTGDAMLCHVASILGDCVRRSDVVARFAGDEFVIIMPESDAAAAAGLTARIDSATVSRPLTVGGKAIRVRLSSGIASIGEQEEETPETLLKRADNRLLEVKRAKKSGAKKAPPARVIPFSPSLHKEKGP